MAQVSITGPDNTAAVLGTDMQTLLGLLAAGINHIDASQLEAGAIETEAIKSSAITLSKLAADALAKFPTALGGIAGAGPISLANSTWGTFGTATEYIPTVNTRVVFLGSLKIGCSHASPAYAWYGLGTTAAAEATIGKTLRLLPASASGEDPATWAYESVAAVVDCTADTHYTFYLLGAQSSGSTRNLDITGTIYPFAFAR